jgi:hypothetical protein
MALFGCIRIEWPEAVITYRSDYAFEVPEDENVNLQISPDKSRVQMRWSTGFRTLFLREIEYRRQGWW